MTGREYAGQFNHPLPNRKGAAHFTRLLPGAVPTAPPAYASPDTRSWRWGVWLISMMRTRDGAIVIDAHDTGSPLLNREGHGAPYLSGVRSVVRGLVRRGRGPFTSVYREEEKRDRAERQRLAAGQLSLFSEDLQPASEGVSIERNP